MKLDQDFIRDMRLCPCCGGFGHIHTAQSIAFGLGLNSEPLARNPFSYHTEHKQYVNFRIGQDTKGRDTLQKAWEKLNASTNN